MPEVCANKNEVIQNLGNPLSRMTLILWYRCRPQEVAKHIKAHALWFSRPAKPSCRRTPVIMIADYILSLWPFLVLSVAYWLVPYFWTNKALRQIPAPFPAS